VAVHTDKVCKDQLTQGNRKHLCSAAMRAYSDQKTPDRSDRENELITELLPMVHRIAGQVVAYLHPPLSFEDMVSAGTVGVGGGIVAPAAPGEGDCSTGDGAVGSTADSRGGSGADEQPAARTMKRVKT